MIVGTVVKITSTVEIDDGSTATSMSIDIYDPADTILVTAASMSTDTATTDSFYYLHQTSTSDSAGEYRAIVTAQATTAYTAIAARDFTLNRLLG